MDVKIDATFTGLLDAIEAKRTQALDNAKVIDAEVVEVEDTPRGVVGD